MPNKLKNIKVLITAGPTWVAIDAVRVISNISSGRTGIEVAVYALKEGAEVTLLLGPVSVGENLAGSNNKRLKVVRFRYFDELRTTLIKLLKKNRYDVIIHSAAVSDYKPVFTSGTKLSSGQKNLRISLKPTVKLINIIRRYAGGSFLVIFKLECGKRPKNLVKIAYDNMRRAMADLAVANNIEDVSSSGHKAYVVDLCMNVTEIKKNKELAQEIFKAAAGKTP